MKTENSTKEKKKKPQGKIDPGIVARRLLEGKMKKKDIAVEAGSKAVTDAGKIAAVNLTARRYKFQKLLDRYMPDKLLAQIHQDGLKSTKMEARITGRDEDGKVTYGYEPVADHANRHKFLRTAYEIKNKMPMEVKREGDVIGITIDKLAIIYGREETV